MEEINQYESYRTKYPLLPLSASPHPRKMTDINEKSISAYENDTRIPPIFNLLEIAQALGVTMEHLCGVAGPKTIEDELLDRIGMEVELVLTEYKIDKILK